MRMFWLLFLCLLLPLPALAMSGGPHLAVGASLGNASPNPTVALGLGMVSHIVLDVLPHNDDSSWLQVISLAAGLWTTKHLYEQSQKDPKVLWGAAGGLLPDLEHLLAIRGIIKKGKKRFPTHNGTISHGKRLEAKKALILELGVTGISLRLIL